MSITGRVSRLMTQLRMTKNGLVILVFYIEGSATLQALVLSSILILIRLDQAAVFLTILVVQIEMIKKLHLCLSQLKAQPLIPTTTLLKSLAKLMVSLPNKAQTPDRKSTRLNSSHVRISYAVFCLKKKI